MGKTVTFKANGNEKQFEACEAWHDQETTAILYGGAKYGGKSYLGGGLTVPDCLMYPGIHEFIARATLNDLRKFTIPTIYEVTEGLGLEPDKYFKFNGHDNFFQFHNGSKLFLIDAAWKPSDPDYHRFGSIQMTRGWMEEIGEMHDKAIENLALTVGRWRNQEYGIKGKTLMTCNPHKGYGYREFYLKAKNGTLEPHKKFITALPQDNKSGDPEYIDSIINHPNKSIRMRLGKGNWEYDDSPDVLIPYDKIIDGFHNSHVPEGSKAMTCDIAFQGSDKFVIGIWSGWRLIKIESMAKSSPKEVESKIKILAEKHEVPRTRIVYDADGIGSFLDSYLRNARPFRNGGKPIGRDNYAHLKSQCGYALARKFNKGEVWIKDHDYQEECIRELEQLKSHNTDRDGKLMIMPKTEIKKQIGHSPDYLDMMIMRAVLDLTSTSMKVRTPEK